MVRLYSQIIKERFSTIHICQCGIKFIEVQAEIDMGYKRNKCPFCVSYKHNGISPPLTHNYEPWAMLEENKSFNTYLHSTLL